MPIIKLDDNWKIDTSNQTATLLFEENKGLNEKTGKDTISKDMFFYATVKQALTAYANRSLNVCESAEEILKKLDEIEQTIKNLKI